MWGGATLTCAVRRHAGVQTWTSVNFMCCHYQSAGEMAYTDCFVFLFKVGCFTVFAWVQVCKILVLYDDHMNCKIRTGPWWPEG